MGSKLTQDEIAYDSVGVKVWSDEARAAALAARQRNKKPGKFPSTGTGHHELSGTAHAMTDRANRKPSVESHNTAAEAHRLAYYAQQRAGNAQLAEDHRRLNIAHLAETRKPKPGKINRDKVRNAGADDSTRGHDKPLAGTQFKPKKPIGKSFFVTGDSVCTTTKPGVKLLVVDAGIDAKAGPWVAVREDRPGVAGMDQKRFVVKPGELKAWPTR